MHEVAAQNSEIVLDTETVMTIAKCKYIMMRYVLTMMDIDFETEFRREPLLDMNGHSRTYFLLTFWVI